MKFLDKFFSMLPLMLISFYSLKALSDLNSCRILVFLLSNAFFSTILKLLIKKKRRVKKFAFDPWQLFDRLHMLNANYGFPSSHTIFYASHFFINPNPVTLVLALLGIFFRVYYQHHTISEIVYSTLITAMLYGGYYFTVKKVLGLLHASFFK